METEEQYLNNLETEEEHLDGFLETSEAEEVELVSNELSNTNDFYNERCKALDSAWNCSNSYNSQSM